MAAEKELKVKLTGDSTQLGQESKKAVASLNEVKGAAQGLLASFTGGVLGGGVAGAVSAIVQAVAGQIVAARQLLRDARSADLDKRFLSGARFFGARINAPENTVESAIANARQARSDAGAGDLDAIENFKRLGISLKEIEDLAPDKLFFRIGDAFAQLGLNKQTLAGGAAILGLQQTQALAPYLAGGASGSSEDRLNLEKLFRGDFSNWFMQGSGIYRGGIEDMLAGDRYKRNIEPITTVGIGDEERAERIRKEAANSVEATLRSQLSIEEQLLKIAEKRAELGKQIDAESNSVKRAKFLTEDASLFAQEVALAKESSRAPKAAALPGFKPEVDEFAQRGVFIGGQQRVPSILEKSLVELQAIVREVRETRKDNKQNFG